MRSLPRRSRVRRRCGTWVPLRGVCPKRRGSDEGRDLAPPNTNSIHMKPAAFITASEGSHSYCHRTVLLTSGLLVCHMAGLFFNRFAVLLGRFGNCCGCLILGNVQGIDDLLLTLRGHGQLLLVLERMIELLRQIRALFVILFY